MLLADGVPVAVLRAPETACLGAGGSQPTDFSLYRAPLCDLFSGGVRFRGVRVT